MLLQIKGVSSGYAAIRVLWDISLEISSGEVIAVIGANGSGKTTLLRTISGLLPVWNGSISFQDQQVTNWPAHKIAKLGIAHVPEGRHLFGPLSVYDNLLSGLFATGGKLDKASRERLFNSVFELFPILRERRTQRAETLSGGEQQMLAIARGLMSAPKLLLIDEPSLGLAPLLINSLTQNLKSINERGISIVLVEQNAHMALTLASRVYVFERGRVAMEGSSQELATDPRVKQIYLG